MADQHVVIMNGFSTASSRASFINPPHHKHTSWLRRLHPQAEGYTHAIPLFRFSFLFWMPEKRSCYLGTESGSCRHECRWRLTSVRHTTALEHHVVLGFQWSSPTGDGSGIEVEGSGVIPIFRELESLVDDSSDNNCQSNLAIFISFETSLRFWIDVRVIIKPVFDNAVYEALASARWRPLLSCCLSGPNTELGGSTNRESQTGPLSPRKRRSGYRQVRFGQCNMFTRSKDFRRPAALWGLAVMTLEVHCVPGRLYSAHYLHFY